MSRFCPLFSSSRGNCTYLGCSDAGLLIDAGVSARSVVLALNQSGIDPSEIKAILVTHSHSDHVSSLKRLACTLKVPLIMSETTTATLADEGRLPEQARIIDADAGEISVGGMTIKSFRTAHDCPGSRGYTVEMPDGIKMAVCTDLGYVSEEVRSSLCGCQLVMLESNHDITMLQKGHYPPELKRRILSENGHLSNAACAAELPGLVRSGTTRLVLGHVSQDNNLPGAVRTCALASLMESGFEENRDFILYIAPVRGGRMLTL